MDAQNSTDKESSLETPKLVLRTYRPTDRNAVDFLFYTTYFSLVPEAVKRKLMAPLTWVIWMAMYAYLLAIVPILLEGMGMPRWVTWALNAFMTIAWALVWFAGIFFYSDRIETVDKVEAARRNDLSDPEVYYLSYNKYERVIPPDSQPETESADGPSTVEPSDAGTGQDKGTAGKKPKKRVTFDNDAKQATELVRELKPEAERTPSHFWVLTADENVCGMVGLACNREPFNDKRPVPPPPWKRLGVWACERYGLRVPALFEHEAPSEPRVFLAAHNPTTATLMRWAVKYDYQGCGLSTPLITRVMNWAKQHGIERIQATTNELQTTAATILRTKYGFQRVKRTRTGWFGQFTEEWVCNVDDWIAKQDTSSAPHTSK